MKGEERNQSDSCVRGLHVKIVNCLSLFIDATCQIREAFPQCLRPLLKMSVIKVISVFCFFLKPALNLWFPRWGRKLLHILIFFSTNIFRIWLNVSMREGLTIFLYSKGGATVKFWEPLQLKRLGVNHVISLRFQTFVHIDLGYVLYYFSRFSRTPQRTLNEVNSLNLNLCQNRHLIK